MEIIAIDVEGDEPEIDRLLAEAELLRQQVAHLPE